MEATVALSVTRAAPVPAAPPIEKSPRDDGAASPDKLTLQNFEDSISAERAAADAALAALREGLEQVRRRFGATQSWSLVTRAHVPRCNPFSCQFCIYNAEPWKVARATALKWVDSAGQVKADTKALGGALDARHTELQAELRGSQEEDSLAVSVRTAAQPQPGAQSL